MCTVVSQTPSPAFATCLVKGACCAFQLFVRISSFDAQLKRFSDLPKDRPTSSTHSHPTPRTSRHARVQSESLATGAVPALTRCLGTDDKDEYARSVPGRDATLQAHPGQVCAHARRRDDALLPLASTVCRGISG